MVLEGLQGAIVFKLFPSHESARQIVKIVAHQKRVLAGDDFIEEQIAAHEENFATIAPPNQTDDDEILVLAISNFELLCVGELFCILFINV